MENKKTAEQPQQTLAVLQERIGHTFSNRELLAEALRHRSVNLDQPKIRSNQRLEFLGDAVLQLIVSDALFLARTDAREGDLSRWRSILTRGANLADLSRSFGVDAALQMSRSEASTGGRTRPSALEDAFEAIVGAIFLDAGYAATRAVVLRWLGDIDRQLERSEASENPKGRLQEIVQPKLGNNAVRYDITSTKGPQHQQRFEVKVFISDEHLGTGWGFSKKEAEESAAREALIKWKSRTTA